ncbi:MAG: spermine/spermidine synthase domain-containing protein [Planctomycetota bacterium]|jgi:SAM-dependent methyltransferase
MKLRLALLLAALSGFIGLSYEIVWIRIYSMVSWGKASAFGTLLGAYLAGLAFGALLARRFCRAEGHRELRALGWFILFANLFGFLLVPGMAEFVRFAPYSASLPLIALGAGLLGTTFPLIAHFGVNPDEHAGAGVSLLYGANILGATAGSLLTGFVLLDFPLAWVSAALTCLGILVFWGLSRRWKVSVLCMVFVIASTPFLFDSLYEKLQFKDEYVSGMRFALIVEGKSGVVTVTDEGEVFGGGVYDGKFNVDPVHDTNGIFRCYAGFAFRAPPKKVLVVGLGSGSWTQVLANHPAVERIQVIEISEDYLAVVRHSPVVRSLLDNPKVSIAIDDGRRWLNRHDERFDWIVQNTTYHFRAHATNLLSREYFELSRRHLQPGGILVYNTTRSLDAQRTGAIVFPHCWLIDNAMIVSDQPLVRDRDKLRGVLRDYAIDGKRLFPDGKTGIEKIVNDDRWKERDWILARTEGAVVITDDNMASEWAHLR